MVILALLLLASCSFDLGETLQPTPAEIMHLVAVNQDREQKARNQFVYDQKVHRTIRHKNGKLLREEFWTYAVTPGPRGTEKTLRSVKGRYLKDGTYLPFEGEPVPEAKGVSVNFDTSSDNPNRDGLDKDLFPLTTEEQTKYSFEKVGEQVVNGRPAYRIQFRPLDFHEYKWTGEALIDKEEFQPVTVYTRLSRKLPFAVRTLLGTDVPGFGVNIQYTRVDKDLWFLPLTERSLLCMLSSLLTARLQNLWRTLTSAAPLWIAAFSLGALLTSKPKYSRQKRVD